jgi:D-alanine transaminase
MTDIMNVNKVYIDGRFCDARQATVSPFDRGFVFGDGVYEVIPVYGGRLFRLEHHWQRLQRSLDAVEIDNPLSRGEWHEVLARLVKDEPGEDHFVYLQVTRGVAPRDHSFPMSIKPTVFAYAQELKPVGRDVIDTGVAAVSMQDIRWQHCDIKATALLANVLLRQAAAERGAVEAILVRDGQVTEGAASNVFIVHHQELVTPPKGNFILPGVTRDLVLEIAAAHGIPAREQAFSEQQLLSADEVWLCSSTKELLPIVQLNQTPVADGRPGRVFQRMYELYQDYKQAFRAGEVD